jgi:uncharacterized membrane protein YdjX (TVP38/TMEM64 family)
MKWLKKRAMFLLTLLLVIATTVALFIFFLNNPEKIKEFENYGYLGGFLISLISTSTVILPTPGILLLVALGAAFNPVLVGLVGAVGGTIGEMTGYILGYSGRGLVRNDRKSNKLYVIADRWMERRGFITVLLFSVVPFFLIDIVGILAGASHFPLWKFLLAAFLGKSVLYITMIQATSWGWDVLLRYIN